MFEFDGFAHYVQYCTRHFQKTGVGTGDMQLHFKDVNESSNDIASKLPQSDRVSDPTTPPTDVIDRVTRTRMLYSVSNLNYDLRIDYSKIFAWRLI